MTDFSKCTSALVRAWAQTAHQPTLTCLGAVLYRSAMDVYGVLTVTLDAQLQARNPQAYYLVRADQERLAKEINEALARLQGLED